MWNVNRSSIPLNFQIQELYFVIIIFFKPEAHALGVILKFLTFIDLYTRRTISTLFVAYSLHYFSM